MEFMITRVEVEVERFHRNEEKMRSRHEKAALEAADKQRKVDQRKAAARRKEDERVFVSVSKLLGNMVDRVVRAADRTPSDRVKRKRLPGSVAGSASGGGKGTPSTDRYWSDMHIDEAEDFVR